MEQTQPKDDIFQHKKTQSKQATCTVWVMHRKSYSKRCFRQGKSILPFEWTIWVQQNRRFNFFDKVSRTLNNHLTSDLLTYVETLNFEVKSNQTWAAHHRNFLDKKLFG